ncbi:bactofilin family protein [Evansella tamaricis]|uniref:Polymer-forming cytoskeletal protein n=1 Tax=Evansella tamaricis TaxID=2069301 RepID=A0ABS6JJ40_9BACI|nr:polymer-forming cytoskeletal protein [Evansella tamaricis]MBU9712343.1 polymer-forming cytoskeletal protein [Evansella tamaricis]
MFSNKKNEKQLNEISTVIGELTTVEGNLNVESSIRIDGKVYGEVICSGDVTVGKDGYVERNLKARNLFIAGKVCGDVEVENKVHILETGFFEGSATMSTIVIEENGQFQGKSLMKQSGDGKQVVTLESENNVDEKTS